MLRVIYVALVATSVASAKDLLGLPVDIGNLLSSLKPAAANDPRFTDFHPPGQGDGMSVVRMSAKITC
jgi:hypothetical protein